MNIKSSSLIVALFASAGAAQAQQSWDFTYTSAVSGILAFGSLTTSGSYAGPDGSGTLVTGGTIDILSDAPGAPVGLFDIIPNPGGNVVIPATGTFQIDDLLYPSNGANSGNLVDYYGLLFGHSGTTEEVNIFGNGGPTVYSLWGSGPLGTYKPTDNDGTFTLTSASRASTAVVPGPAAALPMAFGIIPVLLRRRKKK